MLQPRLVALMVGARRRTRVVAAAAVVLAIAGVFMVSRISFDANILRLLPRRSPAVRSFGTFLESFGGLDHLYLVFEAPDGINDHRDLVDAYLTSLRAAPEIESIDAQLLEPGRDWTYLSDRLLLLLGPAGAGDALARLRPPRLDAELAHTRDLLSMPSGAIKTYVQQDPLGLFAMLQSRLEREKGGLAFDPTQEGYVSRDGRSRLAIVKPRGAPFDTAFCQALFARLDAVERSVRSARSGEAADDAAVRVLPAGSYRISLESERLIRRDGITNAVVSLVLLLVIVVGVFRTPWMLLFGTLPLALAALLSLGLNGILRGSLSPATSGSAGMLFGLGIDAVVLLYVRYLEEREAGRDSLAAIQHMGGAAASVVLAQMTTAATFAALLLLDFPTLNDLGGLVGVGMVLSCVLTLIVLPALLTRADRGRLRAAPSAPWLGRLVVNHAGPIMVIGVVLTVVLGFAARSLSVDTRIERLQADTEGAALERGVAERFGLPQDVLLAVIAGEHMDSLIDADRRLSERVSATFPSVTASGISLLLPSAGVQQQAAQLIQAAGVTPDGAERAVRAAAEQSGFRPDTFAPFFERLPRLIDANQRITYDGLRSHGLGDVISRFLIPREGGFVAVSYLYTQQPVDPDALERTVRSVDPRFELTGMTVVNRDLARRFMPEFLKGLIGGTIAVTVLMWAAFRRLDLTLLALVPTAAGFVWSAGLLALLRVSLDQFSLFATVTFIGIAVDYGIYVIYRHAIEREAMADVLSRTGAAIAIACLTAVVGFGTLVASHYPPLRTFGVMSIVTLTSCLTAALLFLPAVMIKLKPW